MELPLEETTHLFLGKTIEKMDASCCNNVQFLFTDGTRVALHIEVNHLGLPEPLTCVECCSI